MSHWLLVPIHPLVAAKSEGLRLASLFGYTGFFGLTATVLLGMARAVDRGQSRIGGEAIEQFHLAAAILGVCGTVGHIVAHTVRVGAGWGAAQVIVPFVQGGWIVAAGIGAFLLLVVLMLAVSLRTVIGYRSWLLIHRLAYGAAALMALHVVAASDEVARFAFSGIAVLTCVVWMALGLRRRVKGSDDFHEPAVDHRAMERGL